MRQPRERAEHARAALGIRPAAVEGAGEVQGEQRNAERGERHEARRHLAVQQPRAADRAGAHADREYRQQQRDHAGVAAEHVLRRHRQFRQHQRADRPEPRNAEGGQPDSRLARRRGSAPPVPRTMFQSMGRPGPAAGAAGCARRRPGRRAPPAPESRPRSRGPCGARTSALPAMVPARMPMKVPASIRPLPATSSRLGQVVGQDAVFQRAEERRLHAEAEQHRHQQRQAGGEEAVGADRHQPDSHSLVSADQPRLLVAVGQLAGHRREQHVGQDEHAEPDRHQLVAILRRKRTAPSRRARS